MSAVADVARVYTDIADTPGAPLRFAVDSDGALIWASFDDGSGTQNAELSGVDASEDRSRTASVRDQIEAYTAGARRSFDVKLVMRGTPWQVAVWTALTEIPYGETRSYAAIAAAAGRPGAARAVGRANATNRIPLVVPCHRVIAADGSLAGFASGVDVKRRLLEHEALICGRILLPLQGFARLDSYPGAADGHYRPTISSPDLAQAGS